MNIIEKTTQFCNELELNAPGIQESLVRNIILDKTIDLLYEEVAETELAINEDPEGNRAEIVDGFGDIAFVAINGIYKEFRTMGDDHTTAKTKTFEVMLRICEANLAKKNPDGTVTYKNGKVQKPQGWQAPFFDDLL